MDVIITKEEAHKLYLQNRRKIDDFILQKEDEAFKSIMKTVDNLSRQGYGACSILGYGCDDSPRIKKRLTDLGYKLATTRVSSGGITTVYEAGGISWAE